MTETSTAPTRAAVYARVSSAEQARADATSIDEQLRRGRAYADAHAWTVVAEYKDEGISGATPLSERPASKRLLENADRYDAVIFWSMDRFTRNAQQGLADFSYLEDDLGIRIVLVKEAIDTSTPAGRLFRSMLAAFAEFERDTFRDRSMSGRYAVAEQGRWPNGKPPQGYKWDAEKQTVVIDEPAAETIRTIYRLRAEGTTYMAITQHLAERKMLSPRGGLWAKATVRHVLQKPYYQGTGITLSLSPSQNAPAKTFHFPAPALVEPHVWHAVQPGRPQARRSARKFYPLSRRIKHVHNDGVRASMRGMWRGRKRQIFYYRCASASDRNECPAQRTAIRAHTAEIAVIKLLAAVLLKRNSLSLDMDQTEEHVSLRRSKLKELIADAQAERQRWVHTYTQGMMAWEEIESSVRDLGERLREMEQDLADLGGGVATDWSVDDLLSLPVLSGASPDACDEPPRGSVEWLDALWTEACRAESDPYPVLPDWVREEVAWLVYTVDATVYVSEDLEVSISVGDTMCSSSTGRTLSQGPIPCRSE